VAAAAANEMLVAHTARKRLGFVINAEVRNGRDRRRINLLGGW
jgi:hypothetical protein